MGNYENYEKLWNYLSNSVLSTETLTFDDIYRIANVDVDSSFLNRKRDCERYGITIMKINMRDRTVLFARNAKSGRY